jgi:hypothetical protein
VDSNSKLSTVLSSKFLGLNKGWWKENYSSGEIAVTTTTTLETINGTAAVMATATVMCTKLKSKRLC